SMIVVEADDLQQVEAFSRDDPYRQVDLFAEVSIRAWNWTTGNPDHP
ncbi:TPA: YciI family protein, partial [Pseudomonas putida]|nr:YciI family protein [Pseudomonas putida]